MDLRLEAEYSKADFLREIDELKKQVDALRPLPPDVEGRVMQKLRLDWNYHSNAIEGNKLNYGETVAFLMEGITAKGKPLKDHLDIRGHNEAINFLLDLVKDTRPITEADIRALHKLILVEPYRSPAQTAEGQPTTKLINLGEYKTSVNHVKTSTGETHYYATPEETPAKMQELMEWFNTVKQQEQISPVVAAAMFHHKFVAIHPFDDGNGRLSRILMNLVLMQSGFPPVIIKMDDRQNYYSLLSRADAGDNWPFIEYIAELLESSLRLYLKAAKGEDIDEDEDIDKEIALLRIELKLKVTDETEATPQEIFNIVNDQILPMISLILKKIVTLDEFFKNKIYSVNTLYTKGSLLNIAKTDEINVESDFRKIFEIFSDSSLKIQSIELFAGLYNFNRRDNMFDVLSSVKINFNDYGYKIIYSNETITKSYNQNLTKEDQNKIIKSMITYIKNKIDTQIK